METLEQTSITEKFINRLKKATNELEEFRLQAALGKAEARDAYESAKKKFNKYVIDATQKLESSKEIAKEKSIQLKTALEILQVQLALGKADTRDAFEVQRKKITKALNELEELIKKNKTANEYYSKLLLEVGKFKIKLDILKMRYELNKLETRVEYEERKKDLSKKLSDIKKRLLKNEEKAEGKWEHFRDEVSDAYSHLKKALVR